MKKQENGITLVALIITIIILLILAVVSIMAVTGTGLFAKTSDAVEKYENSREKENSIIDNHAAMIDSYMQGNSNGLTGTTYWFGKEEPDKDATNNMVIELSNSKMKIYRFMNDDGDFYEEMDTTIEGNDIYINVEAKFCIGKIEGNTFRLLMEGDGFDAENAGIAILTKMDSITQEMQTIIDGAIASNN